MIKRPVYLIVLIVILALLIEGCLFAPLQPTTTETPPAFQVTFLDVGQADSTLIQCDNRTMLIDAGTKITADSLVNTLKHMGIHKFDVVVATHPHEDHIGGMDEVINQFDIGKIYMPQVSTTTTTYSDLMRVVRIKGLTVTQPVPGTGFNLGSASCSILAPNSSNYQDLNNYSIVIRMLYGNTSFLFTGDAQIDSEKEMLAEGYTLKSDVLKVGHHGSYDATSQQFLNSVSPQYAVIMVGQGNDYGHPHKETLDKLKVAGIKVYRTDLNGNIRFISDGSNLTVKTGR